MRIALSCVLLAACGQVANHRADAANDAVDVKLCGNAMVDPGEDCDDGNKNDNDDCTNACKLNSPFASTGADGAFAPTADTQLPPGIHNYTTITIPAGVHVTTMGTGILELRATGAIEIDGTVDVSGGRGGDGGQGDNSNCDTGGGQGGATGLGIAGAAGTGVNCPAVGLGGQGSADMGLAVAGANGINRNLAGSCPAAGGAFGGGGGAGACSGGAGGGGYAGGGGGAGYSSANGGAGASSGADHGGAPGLANVDQMGAGKSPGMGGHAPGAYAGGNGSLVVGCTTVYPASGGGGGAIGQTAAADLGVTTTFQPGSGGGGGGGQCSQCSFGSGGGGGGGGALRIATTGTLTIGGTAQLLANGGAGGDGSVQAGANAGGGGSGGVIYLSAPTLNVAAGATVSAVGGSGGTSNPNCGGGGAGGLGRIRISTRTTTCTLEGTFTPPLSAGCSLSYAPERVYINGFPH
jgi:cysteine-rich repeat protein